MEEIKKIKVSYPCYAESKQSTCYYTKHTSDYKGWSELKWFSNKYCKIKIITGRYAVLHVPLWLYNKMFYDTNNLI